jgi:molybdopterin/thiamine biosynthesis adenylyltransferase
MKELSDYLQHQAQDGLLSWSQQQEATSRFGCSYAEVEEAALSQGILPARYQRNRQTISTAEQLTLFRSRVAVIGCGGLGGYVIEQLARLGVGQLLVVDPDVFEEHNLNRQLLALPTNLGQAKVTAARNRIAAINPAVTVTAVREALSAANGHELLAGMQLVVDALDCIRVRLELAEVCAGLGVPLVHGAIGGWYGQVTTQFPGDRTLHQIYRHWVEGKGVEQQLGNPAFTPAVVASLQVVEACKVLLGGHELLRHRLLVIDLKQMQFHETAVGDQPCEQ